MLEYPGTTSLAKRLQNLYGELKTLGRQRESFSQLQNEGFTAFAGIGMNNGLRSSAARESS